MGEVVGELVFEVGERVGGVRGSVGESVALVRCGAVTFAGGREDALPPCSRLSAPVNVVVVSLRLRCSIIHACHSMFISATEKSKTQARGRSLRARLAAVHVPFGSVEADPAGDGILLELCRASPSPPAISPPRHPRQHAHQQCPPRRRRRRWPLSSPRPSASPARWRATPGLLQRLDKARGGFDTERAVKLSLMGSVGCGARRRCFSAELD